MHIHLELPSKLAQIEGSETAIVVCHPIQFLDKDPLLLGYNPFKYLSATPLSQNPPATC